jgi:LPXTG-site transpeptidase (sortase) family protein
MGKRRSRKAGSSGKESIGGQWLASLLIWGGVLLMLTGGVIAYPTLQASLAPTDPESLEFVITLIPTLTPAPTLTAQPAAEPVPIDPTATATPDAPPPVVLPETELVSPTPSEVVAEPSPTPEVTPEPTATPMPTPTIDPASLIPSRLVIPAINLDAPVIEVGWDTKEVNGELVSNWIVPDMFAAGWHTTSARPGEPGNTVLNGHHNINGEVFRYLVDLEPDDEIVVYTGETPHYYAVAERHILEEKYASPEVRLENAKFIKPTEDERVTLVTCWPYTNNTHRLIIVALPIQVTPTPEPIVE